jgi:O-antigen/teichoic acid export membrane protein
MAVLLRHTATVPRKCLQHLTGPVQGYMTDKTDSGESSASSVSLGGETLKAILAKFTMALSGFVGTVLFARILGPASFGGFYLLLSIVQMTDRPFRGFERAVKQRIPQDQTDNNEILGFLIGFAALWTVIVLVGGVIFRSWLESYTGLEQAVVPFAVLVVGLLGTTPLTLIQAMGKLGASEWADAVRSYLTLPLQLAFVFLGFGAAGMAYGLAGATLIVAPVGLYYITARPVLPSRHTVLSLWSFAKYSIPTAFVGRAYERFDLLLLGYLLTPAAAADYEVAAKLTLPATFVASATAALLMPRVSQLKSRGENVVEDISNALAFGSILSIPIFFGALAIPESIIVTVYGGEYSGAALLLIAISVYRILGTQTEVLLQSLDGIDMPQATFKLSTVALVVNVILGVYLVNRIGAVGVVAATVAAEVIRYIGAGYILSKKIEGLSLVSAPMIHQLFTGTVMYGVVEGATMVLDISSWVELVGVVSLGAAVYGILLFAISDALRATTLGIFEGTEYEQALTRLVNLFESK